MVQNWLPSSWRGFYHRYFPDYSEEGILELEGVEEELRAFSGLVSFREVSNLRKAIESVISCDGIFLHCGRCAELFFDSEISIVDKYYRLFAAIRDIITLGLGIECPILGRICGQFAKPRTVQYEEVAGVLYPVYAGDMVNGLSLLQCSRLHDPRNLVEAYKNSVKIRDNLNVLVKEEFGCGIYVSHECLILPYEEAFTLEEEENFYNTLCHLLWVGNKTRDHSAGHIEYVRGLYNPVAVKIDQSVNIDTLLHLVDTINPNNDPGKLVLISRMGANVVEMFLPSLMRGLKYHGISVVWECDPMHGNTKFSVGGRKIRLCEDIMRELKQFFDVKRAEGIKGAGLHLEVTIDDFGGCFDTHDKQVCGEIDLVCDPEMTRTQALEIADFVVQLLKNT